MTKLRSYQSRMTQDILDAWTRSKSTLCVSPTGTGKTRVLSEVIKRRLDVGRCLVLTDRDAILEQNRMKIYNETGIFPDIEKASQWADRHPILQRSPIICASLQTQHRGLGHRTLRFDPQEFPTVIVDEAHRAVTKTYRTLIRYYEQNPEMKLLGLTATPYRKDNKSLGQVFQSVAHNYPLLAAIDDGWLVNIEYSLHYLEHMNISRVNESAGDLNAKELDEILRFEKVIGPMADQTFQSVPRGRRAIIFCGRVAQAARFAEILNRMEQNCAEYVHDKTPQLTRIEMYRAHQRGEFRFLCNCTLLGEGYDDPTLTDVVIARPTLSALAFAQWLGRVTRPLPDILSGLDDDDQHMLPVDGHTLPKDLRKKAIQQSDKPVGRLHDFCGNCGRHARKIVSAFSVFAGANEEPEVIEMARKEAAASGKPTDIMLRVQAAKERLARERGEAERRRSIVYKSDYHTKTGLLNGTALKHSTGYSGQKWRPEPPSSKVRGILERAGMWKDGMSKGQAGALVGKIMARPSKAQADLLRKYGYDPNNYTRKTAHEQIDKIAENGWKRPKEAV